MTNNVVYVPKVQRYVVEGYVPKKGWQPISAYRDLDKAVEYADLSKTVWPDDLYRVVDTQED